MQTKPVLAFDCATSAANVALCVDGATHTRHIAQGRQAVELVAVIDALMRAHNVDYSDLAAIVTTDGPGSFTGLRVGLAALHGLVLARSVPVKIISSLEALAWEVLQNSTCPATFFTALNAGKGEVYLQPFRSGPKPEATADITLLEQAEALEIANCYGNLHAPEHAHYLAAPSAALLCAIAPQLAETPLAQALPRYIRAPDAKLPATPTWLLPT
jgi:tRNA threonylcarbamoyl adenosine modification protein YeaZ